MAAQTMRACVYRALGGPQVLQVVEFPRPTRGKGEVMLQVIATSVNPVDYKTRKGDLPTVLVKLPKIPNGDVAGIVLESDPGSKFKPGDRVFGCSEGNLPWKTYGAAAEYHSVGESKLALMPPGLSFTDAAAIPLAGATAYQALLPGFPLQGKNVLIHAGAGGVGSMGIQIAKALGATVATTCSSRNVDVVKQLGADIVFDYTKEPFDVAARKQGLTFDLVVDPVGGDYEPRSIQLLKKKGHFSNILNSGYQTRFKSQLLGIAAFAYELSKNATFGLLSWGPSYSLIVLNSDANKSLDQILELVKAGKFKPLIDRILPLEASAEAHAYLEKGHARGKVVLEVGNDPSGSAKK